MTATLTLSPVNQLQFEKAIRVGIARLNEHYGITCPVPKATWSLRGQGRLGAARGYFEIKLHKGYAAVLGAEYLDTVLHEVAHIVTSYRSATQAQSRRDGRWSPHGAEWKAAMRVLGLRPDRCASVSQEVLAMVPPARKTVRVKVSCSCSSYQVTPQKATSVTRPGVICKKCRSSFKRES